MKFERVSSNRIKITVTNEDMSMLGISFESFIVDSPERSELFRSLLKRAEFETGLAIDNSRVMIEASPGKLDGIEMFFTKLDSNLQLSQKPKLRAKPKKEAPNTLIYAFDGTEPLLEFAERAKLFSDGDLYFFAEKYYLVLPSHENRNILISEYAALDRNITKAFLSEHGTLIVKDNALKTIDKYFNIGG